MTKRRILSVEKVDAIIEEIKIQEGINTFIEQKKNFKFEAGAGSGKTYALKESLKYILDNNSEQLKNKNQKILCITYTNVAKNEITADFGHNSLLQVNTIHEFIWDLISSHQNLLYIEHASKIKHELNELTTELEASNILEPEKLDEIAVSKESIERLFSKDEFRDTHYLNYSKNANGYRAALESVGWEWDLRNGPLSNVTKFKSHLGKYYKHLDLEKVKNEMIRLESGKIKYANIINRDRLHKYEISHDTVLDYGHKIIKKYELIRKVIVDSYPYILVDEYQDTNHKVIELLKVIVEEEQKYNEEFVVGFFGDRAQSIYSNGVGEKIDGYLPDLELVDKPFNRRSCDNVIEISNKIRDDDINQISIYSNSNFGKIKIESLKWDSLDELYSVINQEVNSFNNYELLESSSEVKNMVMMAKHEDLAELSGFGSLYKIIKSFDRYSDGNYERIGTHFLTKEDNDLDFLWGIFNELIRLQNIDSEDLFSKLLRDNSLLSGMTYSEAARLIKILKEIQIYQNECTIKEYLEFIFEKTVENKSLKKIYQNFIGSEDERLTLESFIALMYKEKMIIPEDEDEDENENEYNERINDFLNISFKELNSWYDYRKNNYKSKGINYSTMHGTKGAEFENVILVLDDSFSRRKDYFSYFFENYLNHQNLTDNDKKRFIEARNLLYVACSRARVNLTIIIPEEMYENNKLIINEIFKTNNDN